MIDIIEITLKGVGYAIFNMSFLFGVWLVYIITRRLSIMDYYRMVVRKPFLFHISDIILQGIFVGIIASLVLVYLGIPLYYNDFLLLIIPISLALSIFRIRLLCISYSSGLLAIFSLLFDGQIVVGMQLPDIEIHIPSLIILVGLLHLMEGILVLLTAHEMAIPVLSKKEDTVVMGHIIQKNWPIPLGLLVVQLGIATANGVVMPQWWPMIKYSGTAVMYSLLPVIGLLGYSSITYTETPKARSRYAGLSLIGFSIVTLFMGVISVNSIEIQVVGVTLMVFLHEGLYHLEQLRENRREPIFGIPLRGIRIMQVIEGGYAARVGMKQGDVIEEVNGTLINDVQHFIKLIKETKDTIIIYTKSLRGKEIKYVIENHKDLEQMGIRVIPEKPLILYPFNQFKGIGIFNFFKRG